MRKLATHLLIGIYVALQMMAIPHSHATVNEHPQQNHAATHFHCTWASSGHHHHDSDHSHAAHDHHHRDEVPPPSNPQPHDADAVYVGDSFVTSAVRIADSDADDGLTAVAILSSCAPEIFDARVAARESAENFFADATLYLILRALRI